MQFENVGMYRTTQTFVLLGNKGEKSWATVAKLDLPDYDGDEDKIVKRVKSLDSVQLPL